MTTELEKEFFRVFGIEPFCDLPCNKRGIECTDNTYCSNKYSEINAEKLLEMICILSNYGKYDCWGVTIARLKNAILENCIAVVTLKLLNDAILEQFKQRIQQLFKE